MSPYALVLFGGNLVVRHRKARLCVGAEGWVEFRAEPKVGVLAKALRSGLTQLLSNKVANPAMDLSKSPIIAACLKLLNGNGY